ncbi:TIGR00341 family protein [Halomarina oriensis]|uniref:TIGR00341 family protein n=1 Tax=Halomarina oriensis TaxID=671145 RepID=A0A6B0GDY7_9EURY|nr:TIGR00341 family protein [Halomarina oriensis]MWG33022.1 TIGR00341 family protein [Halomarina oriensis]
MTGALSREDIRVVQVLALSPSSCRRVRELLDDDHLDYAVAGDPKDPEGPAILSVPVPARSVEHLQERLTEVGDDLYTVVLAPEAVLSSRFEEDPYDEVVGRNYHGVSRGELRSTADDMLPSFGIHTLLTVVSAVVAVAGVLLDSLAVLVGAMVIAPLVGPPMVAGVATVVDDTSLFRRSLARQVGGLVVGAVSATLAAFVFRFVGVGPPTLVQLEAIANHVEPGFLLVLVALGAGIAGAVSLSMDDALDLIGVMIAAAVVPPLGVVGVGVAWGFPVAALGAATVVLVNVVTVNIAAILTLWWLGYHPAEWAALRRARSTLLVRVLVLAVVGLTLAVVLGGLTDGTMPGWWP